ncbi:hypothetical protein Tco_1275427 [Tanacetum coccineum]
MPILLKEVFSDFGPTPFRFYHSWLELPGFDDLVSKFWNSFTLDDSNGLSKDLKSKLCDIDKVLDQGGVTEDILLSRLEVLKQLHDVQSSNNRDIMPKGEKFMVIGLYEHVLVKQSFEGTLRTDSKECGFLDEGKALFLLTGVRFEYHYYEDSITGGTLFKSLFVLLIMESLHLSFSRAVEAGIFKGYKIDPSTTLSHLFYADDAVFIGEWSHSNLKGILNILDAIFFISNFYNGIQEGDRKIAWVKWSKVFASKGNSIRVGKCTVKLLERSLVIGDNLSSFLFSTESRLFALEENKDISV